MWYARTIYWHLCFENMKQNLFIGIFTALMLQACGQNTKSTNEPMTIENKNMVETNLQNKTIDTATFGAGCFWCIEAVFQRLDGVISVESGYAGGRTKNPSYQSVTGGLTGHAEVARIVFNPSVISYVQLLEIFWVTHDPTTLNRQGNDIGTQYRSAIFYHNDYQKQLAEQSRKIADESGLWNAPIVTEVSPLNDNYYPAENYHQNYYNQNKQQGYCTYVISPKIEKVHKLFIDKLKSEYKNELN